MDVERQTLGSSETDHSEILSPTPRRHYLLQQQFSSQWLQSPNTTTFNPTTSRPSSPLNPHHHDEIRSSYSSNYQSQRKHKHTLSFSSLAESARPGSLSRSRKHGSRTGKTKPKPTESLARRFVRWMDRSNMTSYITPTILLITIFIKWAVGLGSYSGYNTPPMYGDYEAQRHWLEITYHLPVKQWYWYDLPYWGLDYPPLTAYVSWVCGYVYVIYLPGWSYWPRMLILSLFQSSSDKSVLGCSRCLQRNRNTKLKSVHEKHGPCPRYSNLHSRH